MFIRAWGVAAVLCLAAVCPGLASPHVLYGPPPDWVDAPPQPTGGEAPAGAPVRFGYLDVQTRLGPEHDETHTAYRLKILTPEGLVAGNIAAAWHPSSDQLTVNALRVFRDSQVIDVLADTRFQVIQRENNLEYASLDGELTASLQVPGLQVGDELELAVTLRRRDPVFGARSSGFIELPDVGAPGAYRARLIWPEGKTVHRQVTPDLGEVAPVVRDGQHALTWELRDPVSVVATDGAPDRFNVRRLIEYSGFSSWGDITGVLWPLYDEAWRLAPESPVRQEAAKIAAATTDPVERTEAALALVQERIRYLYVGLDGANYRPARAEHTWSRRYGDCKGQVALLIALLRELGIAAEAVLVNALGGDGTDERLPAPALFNHVVVRATVGDRTYWLDPTRPGERRLTALSPPTFRWALPIRPGAVDLEPVAPQAPTVPQYIQVLEIDASAGFEAPAKVSAQQILRGEWVYAWTLHLSGVAPEDVDRRQKAFWREALPWAEPSATTWSHDERRGVVVLTMTGEGKPGWETDTDGHSFLDVFASGFFAPRELRRPAEQDQSAPWSTDFPAYRCWVTTIRLPPPAEGWGYRSPPINLELGGTLYRRDARLENGVMRTVKSKRTFLPEITAEQAREHNVRLPRFDKYVSRVFQVPAVRSSVTVSAPPTKPEVEGDAVDWTDPETPCTNPAEPQPAAASQPPAPPRPPVEQAEDAEPEQDDDMTVSPRQDPAHPIRQPHYPVQSLMAREEGAVILEFTVKADGTVDPATIGVDESSGYPALDAAAMIEAATWRFLPATRKGEPVASPHKFRVVFQMRGMPGAAELLPQMPAILQDTYIRTSDPSSDPSRPITQPPYPADALAARAEGDVILQFLVEADGFVDPNSIVVKKSSGFASLDQAAVSEAAVNWRFRPAMRDGRPVAAPHRFRVVFELSEP
jgi:TonB family protein